MFPVFVFGYVEEYSIGVLVHGGQAEGDQTLEEVDVE